MLASVDSDGFSLTMLDTIIDYQKDDAVAVLKNDSHDVVTPRGQKQLRKTTVGWKLCVLVKLKDQSKSY